MTEPVDGLADLWAWFADTQFRGYSPLYERVARAVSTDTAVLAFVREAPPEAHLPPVLLAAVHYLLLGGLAHPLGDVYRGQSSTDPGRLFLDLCHEQADELAPLLEVRRIQTNDCGRSALLGPGLTWLGDRVPGPMALVDVGASAGLNLIADRYRLDYGEHGATGPPTSPVIVHCAVAGGHPPIAGELPTFASREGLDRSPIDLADPDDARWLLACVWPDTGRLERTAASIRLAQESLPTVHGGDAVDDLPRLLDRLDGRAAVVVNSWAYSYLDADRRRDYVAALAEMSKRRTVAWLLADGGSVLGEIPGLEGGDADGQALGTVIFERGAVSAAQLLATVHQHGTWIDWRAD